MSGHTTTQYWVKKLVYGLGLFILLVALVLPLTTSAQDGGSVASDEDVLAEAIAPPRDRVSLAQRFFGMGDVPAVPTTPEKVYQVGDVETFFVQNFTQGTFEIQAEMVYTNAALYIWVEQGYSLNSNAVKLSADEFATQIYEQQRALFGSEASPGIDGDPKLHVLHSSNLGGGIAAYYYSESQFPQEAVSSSNEREMFFVNLDNMSSQVGTEYYTGVLSHEFQHMIHWAVDSNEESWLNEGLSELAAFYTGYGVSGFATNYLVNTDMQLTYWPDTQKSVVYGGSFLFNGYLLDRFGAEAIRALVANPANGMTSVNQSLSAVNAIDPIDGQPMTAERLFIDFSAANYVQDITVANGQYGYKNAELASLPQAAWSESYLAPNHINIANIPLNQWSSHYYRVSSDVSRADQTYTVNFTGNDSVGILPLNAFSGEFAWWSNQVDNSDTRLTRAFDLSTVDSATLTFWIWYDIESDWDYAYVAISTDGGATWETLATDRTTTSDPHNNSYGNGYTGQSNDWVQESIDLSAYTGQEVWVRFEYITDDATIENGFYLDDVAIPEIVFFDDFEQVDETWEAEGWARIQNNVRQSFFVQMIEFSADGSANVTRLLTDEDGSSGNWSIVMGDKEIVFIVSALAPITTEPATFSLSVAAID